MLNHYILYPTTSCSLLYIYILYLVITISRTFTCSPARDAVVLYIVVSLMSTHYILGTISCTPYLLRRTTVTTRFSPTRRRFSRGLQYKGKSVPPNTESFHLANSTRYSTCNIAYTTTSSGFSAYFDLCTIYTKTDQKYRGFLCKILRKIFVKMLVIPSGYVIIMIQ